MSFPLKFASIPESQYPDYRTKVIFKAYKWDPQVNDQNTIAKFVLLITRETAAQLGAWAEQLSQETMKLEEALIHQLPLLKGLHLPLPLRKALPRLTAYKAEQNIRLMRFDFHPTETGWAVSEVNSDVPGGLAEGSVWPEIAKSYIDGCPGENVAEHLLKAFQKKMKNGNIVFVHATSYSDDRQVMQFLGDYFTRNEFNSIYAAPDHITWIDGKAVCKVNGEECLVDGIVRFFPLEWLINLPGRTVWQGYFDSQTPSCNSPVALFAQSKRLPLIWDSLGIDIPVWKQLLPETQDPGKKAQWNDDWIYKPALGRVGEGISIKEAVPQKEMAKIRKAVHKRPGDWIVQRRFNSKSIPAEDGKEYHVCIGVFTVDNKFAGFYGRINTYPRIDENAIDIPILIAD